MIELETNHNKPHMSKKSQSKSNLPVTTNASVPATVGAPIDFARDAGAGLEGAGMESFAIPMLLVLQKGSPQVDEASGKLVAGAKAGMFYESIGDALTDGKTGIQMVPCAYRRTFLRWSADDAYQGEIPPEEVSRRQLAGTIAEYEGRLYVTNAAGKIDPKISDRVQDVRNHYVLILDQKTGDWRQALLSLRSTQIKKSRMLMTALASVKMKTETGTIMPPTYANVVRATTAPESNDRGSWFGWQFKLEGFVTDPELYAAAKKFHQAITAGLVKHEYADDGLKDPGAGGF